MMLDPRGVCGVHRRFARAWPHLSSTHRERWRAVQCSSSLPSPPSPHRCVACGARSLPPDRLPPPPFEAGLDCTALWTALHCPLPSALYPLPSARPCWATRGNRCSDLRPARFRVAPVQRKPLRPSPLPTGPSGCVTRHTPTPSTCAPRTTSSPVRAATAPDTSAATPAATGRHTAATLPRRRAPHRTGRHAFAVRPPRWLRRSLQSQLCSAQSRAATTTASSQPSRYSDTRTRAHPPPSLHLRLFDRVSLSSEPCCVM
jgi:hypothetical protein